MSLAEDISKAAIAFRSKAEPLKATIERWSRKLFWDQDPDNQLRSLISEVKSSEDFQMGLADVIGWEKPRNDSAELTLLAIDAARGKGPKIDAAIFGSDLDWNSWKKQPDLHKLQLVFENNAKVRNGFARAIKAFPGRQHAEEIAIEGFDQWKSGTPKAKAVQDVLRRFLLNWEAFNQGLQDQQFREALTREYEFRDEVARAVEFNSGEARELAELAVDMWKAAPIGFSRKVSRRSLLTNLKEDTEGKALRDVLAGSVDQDQDWNGWGDIEARLSVLFAQTPLTSCALWEAMSWPRPFALVLREELRQIEASRNLKKADDELPEPPLATAALDASDLAAHKKLFGLAFSGGGIRSATFNLGVLQKLSKIGLLEKVDYLSTVSGGGYIGSWLAAWISNNGGGSYSEFRSNLKDLLAPTCPDPRAPSQRPIRFLREFSNYLTPKLGGFSFDSWTMAAVYSRNVILNQAVLIFCLATILLIPRLMWFDLFAGAGHSWSGYVAGFALLIGVLCMSLNVRNAVAESAKFPWPSFFTPVQAQLWVVLPILISVYAASLWFWFNEGVWSAQSGLTTHDKELLWDALRFSAVLSLLLTTVGGFVTRYRNRHSTDRFWWAWMLVVIVVITALSSGASVGLLSLYLNVLNRIRGSNGGVWHAEIWGPIMLLATLVVPGTLQVGLMGVDYPDSGREWLSRFRAVCSIYATSWILWMCAAIYGPILALILVIWTRAVLSVWLPTITIGWVVTTAASIGAGKSSRTGRDKDGNPKFSWLQLVAKAGPPVFISGLLLLIATLEAVLLAYFRKSSNPSRFTAGYWDLLEPASLRKITGGWNFASPWFVLIGLVLVGLVLAWRVDINEFSMHHFYKNRLVRCYLGASNEDRHPNPFTGFDGQDDFNLAELLAIGKKPYLGPYPLLNTTLNLSAGKQLAWQERKAASFTFSPSYCGFDLHGWSMSSGANGKLKTKSTPFYSSDTLRPVGYRKTQDYSTPGGPLLGTAMSISGAAANPNQGYNTSPAVSFLMTMFDVRLGWWLGNPRRDVCSGLSSPRFGLLALFSELLGQTDDETRFVNLSDGGHFDNMGLYELVRRRCAFIILCDAEQDHAYTFGGLGAAIRKCRVDFGALIEIDPSRIKPAEDGKPSASHCTVGTIKYLDGSEGILLYIKSSLTGDEPEDVAQYHAVQKDFPHETTADQWFTESQFESYRALGFHATHYSLNPATAWLKWDADHPDVPHFFEALRNYWYPVNPSLKGSASKHTATLSDLLERLRKNIALHQLGSELFPGAFTTQNGPRPVTEEFYFSMCIIQLMEDLFFDFQLDHQKWFYDPRIGGWRYLFQRWKNVPSVSSAWAAERDTFRKDFQLFWSTI